MTFTFGAQPTPGTDAESGPRIGDILRTVLPFEPLLRATIAAIF
jgi:hypothetical protein